jgi:PKD repeat protein
MWKKSVISLFFVFLFLHIVHASITLQSEQIPRNVTAGQPLTGSVTLKLISHPGDTLITSSYPHNRTSLLEWLEQGGALREVDYTCSMPDCKTRSRATSLLGASITLSTNESVSFGFNITKQNAALVSFSLNISSNAPASCSAPFILSIGTGHPLTSTAYQADLLCGTKNYGCFNRDLSSLYSLVEITQQGLCSHMLLPTAPAYLLGGRVQNTSTGTSTLSMKVYRNDTEFVGGCTLPTLSSSIQDLSCTLNQSLQQGGYYVCIAAEQANSNYQVQIEETVPVCGTAELGGAASVDYELFAQPYGYAPPQQISLEQAFQSQYGQPLGEYLDDSIASDYNRECGGGCSVPFTFQGISQTIQFIAPQTRYSWSGNTLSTSSLYLLTPRVPTVTGNVTLSLGPLGIRAPTTAGTSTFTLKGGSTTIATVPLTVAGNFQVRLLSSTYYPGVSTSFVLLAPENITSVVWTFGDGQSATTTGNGVSHIYASGSENITLSVVARSGNGKESRMSFILVPADPHTTFTTALNRTSTRLASLERDLNLIPATLAGQARNDLGLANVSALVQALRSESVTNATIGEQLARLNGVTLPARIGLSTIGSAPLAAYYTELDSSYAPLVYGPLNMSNTDEITLNIIEWINTRFSGTAHYQRVSMYDEQGVATPYGVGYTLVLTRTEFAQDTSLVVDFPLSEVISPPSDAQPLIDDTHSGFSIPLAGKDQIALTFKGDPDLTRLGMFILPDKAFFTRYAQVHEKKEPFPTVWFGIAWFIWVIGFLVAYIVLQEWYKRHYEYYLFRNKDDLYNVITFVYNGRLQGTEDQQIRKKLAQSGWTGEQIAYAIKKFEGKRTGMWEIPLFSYWEHKKIQREITKRRGNGEGKVY